ncbi:MAG: CopG family transcriptional regulator [Betaproteobacteria bacterium]|nr:CopG family transcriptional regulator [Betaproteobacteria bacterium]
MRTTLSIDDDVLNAAKHEALRRNASLSEVATDLIRAGLRAGTDVSARPAATIGRPPFFRPVMKSLLPSMFES